MIPNQVALPPADSGPGDLWSKITGPLAGPLSGAWWFVLHIIVPGALIVGVAGMIFAGLTGNRTAMVRARGALVAIPLALVLAAVAAIVANWAVGAWS